MLINESRNCLSNELIDNTSLNKLTKSILSNYKSDKSDLNLSLLLENLINLSKVTTFKLLNNQKKNNVDNTNVENKEFMESKMTEYDKLIQYLIDTKIYSILIDILNNNDFYSNEILIESSIIICNMYFTFNINLENYFCSEKNLLQI